MKMSSNKGMVVWGVLAPAVGAMALTALSAGMSDGPWAFAYGFGIGICVVATLAGVVGCVRQYRAA